MDKRLPLALALCLLIVLGWPLIFPSPKRPAQAVGGNAATTGEASAGTPGAPAAEGETAPDEPAPDEPAGDEPAAEAAGPVIVGEDEPDLVLSIGEPGAPGSYRAVFQNRGGALAELRTARYFDTVGLHDEERLDPEHWTVLVQRLETGERRTASMVLRAAPSAEAVARVALEEALWSREVIGEPEHPRGVEFTLAPGTGVVFRKRILFREGEDTIDLELDVENVGYPGDLGSCELILTPVACMPAESGDRWYSEPQAISCLEGREDEPASAKAEVIRKGGDPPNGPFPGGRPISFVGVFNKYFAMLLHASDDASKDSLVGSSWRRLRDEAFARAHPDESGKAFLQIVADAQIRLLLPPPGETRTVRYAVYAGPKDRKVFLAAWKDHEQVVQHDLGFFAGIASILVAVLNFFESITGNWGVAIILLTITVRGILFPVNRRSQTAMSRYQAKMKRLQPRIEEIKKRYEKDPTAQRQEQAKLMQQEGAFPPLGGCLPMFLQIPVFIGLFAALRSSFDLRQAKFALWIQDLSLPDQLLKIGLHLPWPIGNVEYLNVLPPLMVVLWIWQQKTMPMPADEQAQRMQKMMLWMPVMMGFFLYNYAAGLSLYMITQSGLGILEQRVIKKVWPLDDTEKPRKRSAFMAKLLEAQEQQKRVRDKQRRGKGRR